MTDQEIRIAIAEECRFIPGLPGAWSKDGEVYCLDDLPDYPNDLNAMHEAEKTLLSTEWEAYEFLIRDAVTRNEAGHPWSARDIHATARQRAEAFLRTVGKWKD